VGDEAGIVIGVWGLKVILAESKSHWACLTRLISRLVLIVILGGEFFFGLFGFCSSIFIRLIVNQIA
jgi:hypothetical protein